MPPIIKIKQLSSDEQDLEFEVEIQEGEKRTSHRVTVAQDFYQNLTEGKIPTEELVKISFQFLLAKEPKESILRSFNIEEIQSYFPEYEGEIKKRI